MKYCLDTNVFIEAWNKYYAYDFCRDYWEKLNQLAQEGILFTPDEVKREINKIDDNLGRWFKTKDHFFRPISKEVITCLQVINRDEKNHRLVDSSKFRSIADPWVIAHAMAEHAVVVTKEEYESNETKRIKIPNVCESLGIECIDDFELIRRLQFQFKLVGE